MKLIDTHAHLFADEFKDDLANVVNRAKQAGVQCVIQPNIDAESIEALKNSVREYPDFFIPMMGLHPTSVAEDWRQQLDTVGEELSRTKYIAVGEIGLDLYWDRTFEQEQIEVFETQLKWSAEKNLPVSIHSRNAIWEVCRSIKKVGIASLRGIFHSFGGNVEELDAILDLKNFHIGINGVVTFKKSGLSETLQHCDLSHIVLETDSPYLAPVPYRGKRNESAYLKEIVQKLSEIYGKTTEEIANITTENAKQVFGI
ncbi:MAG: TatD family hydrolase [Dysgonamonadaceae bacterium]|jgi:TatD DNase family protein|nr:TatD family hydrolase [Dysgonamonadaceae bacterium]